MYFGRFWQEGTIGMPPVIAETPVEFPRFRFRRAVSISGHARTVSISICICGYTVTSLQKAQQICAVRLL